MCSSNRILKIYYILPFDTFSLQKTAKNTNKLFLIRIYK